MKQVFPISKRELWIALDCFGLFWNALDCLGLHDF